MKATSVELKCGPVLSDRFILPLYSAIVEKSACWNIAERFPKGMSQWDPRSNEKIAETRIIPENTRRACCKPRRKPPREPLAVWTLVIRFGLPIMLASF